MDAGRWEFDVFRRPGEEKVILQKETRLKEIGGKPQDPGKPPKARFGVFGEEMIEKQVKPAGNSGRVYLPLDWVGKHVKIIRID